VTLPRQQARHGRGASSSRPAAERAILWLVHVQSWTRLFFFLRGARALLSRTAVHVGRSPGLSLTAFCPDGPSAWAAEGVASRVSGHCGAMPFEAQGWGGAIPEGTISLWVGALRLGRPLEQDFA